MYVIWRVENGGKKKEYTMYNNYLNGVYAYWSNEI